MITSKTDNIISVQNLTKVFRSAHGELHVLDSLNFDVRRNESFAIIGPSGCGKSTLLKIIGGLQSADTGDITLDGLVINSPSRRMSFLFQEDGLFPWKTVEKNILFALEAHRFPKSEWKPRLEKYVEMVGLTGFEGYFPHQLSGGMKQRAALARALVTEPEILLMDEPLASLDMDLREKLQEEIRNIHRELACTIVFISHNIDEVVYLADRAIVLTQRPAKPKETVLINLPTNRTASVRASDAFLKTKARIWKLVRGI